MPASLFNIDGLNWCRTFWSCNWSTKSTVWYRTIGEWMCAGLQVYQMDQMESFSFKHRPKQRRISSKIAWIRWRIIRTTHVFPETKSWAIPCHRIYGYISAIGKVRKEETFMREIILLEVHQKTSKDVDEFCWVEGFWFKFSWIYWPTLGAYNVFFLIDNPQV